MEEFIRDLVDRLKRVPETGKTKPEVKPQEPKEIIQREREYYAGQFRPDSIVIPISQVWAKREWLGVPPKDLLEAISDDQDFPRLKIIFREPQSDKFTPGEFNPGKIREEEDYEANRKKFLKELDWINKIKSSTVAAREYEKLSKNILLGRTESDDLWGPTSQEFM